MLLLSDFSKAFDTVHYDTVLKQLHNVGFSRTALCCVFNYLTGRQQFVQINEKQSELVDVEFGVPQGSIVGRVLFNLYVNDLKTDLGCSCFQYADNTTLYRYNATKTKQKTEIIVIPLKTPK